jgi:hypothetical protein
MYSVKNVKSFTGMEGYGFNCDLFHHNVKIASVIDSGNGGMFNIRWTSKEVKNQCVDFCKSQPKITNAMQGLSDPQFLVEYLISELVDNHKQLKNLRPKLKKNIFFVQGNKLLQLKAAPTPENLLLVKSKYSGATILNELSDDNLLKAISGVI